ncbi:hypothetical protein IscW_ISCW018377 [Ixodes scapularis]|uniref:Uncharacterized protein n=1 Tax=Ixodes scapularis TaxID=6945 RepID=B7PK48_IXOSC|nr:hypothetical protein IscW_ISCW018377 [Ixodes scapularis]|eukprot:XP_002409286.1 hypothetical protein IscW_ISCW018377 [Ixodes scapularis]
MQVSHQTLSTVCKHNGFSSTLPHSTTMNENVSPASQSQNLFLITTIKKQFTTCQRRIAGRRQIRPQIILNSDYLRKMLKFVLLSYSRKTVARTMATQVILVSLNLTKCPAIK